MNGKCNSMFFYLLLYDFIATPIFAWSEMPLDIRLNYINYLGEQWQWQQPGRLRDQDHGQGRQVGGSDCDICCCCLRLIGWDKGQTYCKHIICFSEWNKCISFQMQLVTSASLFKTIKYKCIKQSIISIFNQNVQI